MGGGGTETSGAPGTNAGAMGIYDPGFAYGAYNPSSGIGSAVSKGFQTFGSSVASGSQAPNFITQQTGATPYSPAPAAPGLIPEQQDDDLISVLKRLLESAGTGPTGIPMSLQ